MIEVYIYPFYMFSRKFTGGMVVLDSATTGYSPESWLMNTVEEMNRKGLDGIIRVNCDLNAVFLPVSTNKLVIDFFGHTINNMSVQLYKRHSNLTLMNAKILNTYYTNGVFLVIDGNLLLKNCDVTCTNYRVANVGYTSYAGRAKMKIDKDTVIRSKFSADYIGGGVSFFCAGTIIANLPNYHKKMKGQAAYQKNFIDREWRTEFYCDGTIISEFPSGGDNEVAYCICTNGSAGWVGPDITIGKNAKITVTGRTTGIGIHQVAGGTLTLLGGEITAPTGITCRSARVYAPADSTVKIHATGDYAPYIINTGAGIGGTNMTTGNAVMVEAFRTGYGSTEGSHLTETPDVKLLGGTFQSDNNLAVGSFSHTISGGGYYPRTTKFVSPSVQLVSNREHEPSELEYNYETGSGGDWEIVNS
jgi:hypothetical protein